MSSIGTYLVANEPFTISIRFHTKLVKLSHLIAFKGKDVQLLKYLKTWTKNTV